MMYLTQGKFLSTILESLTLNLFFMFVCVFSSPEPADPGGLGVLSPKHVPIPNIPRESELWFFTIELFFSGIVCFLQFLHLYRSVWWLPQSYTVHAMVSSFNSLCTIIDYLELAIQPSLFFCV